MQTTLTALAVITVGYILAYLAPDIMRRLLWEVSKAVLAGLRGGIMSLRVRPWALGTTVAGCRGSA